MNQLLTYIFLISVLAVSAFAGAELPRKDRKLHELVLTSDELFELSFVQKITYFRYLLEFMATMEDLQSVRADSNVAKAHVFRQLQEFLLSEAHAETYVKDASIVGKTCIHSATVSEYYKASNGQYYCKDQSRDCGGGKRTCAEGLSGIIPELKTICIRPPKPGVHPGHTALCVQEVERKLGSIGLGNGFASVAERLKNPEEVDKYKEMSVRIQGQLKEFAEARMNGGLSVREYCGTARDDEKRGQNSANSGLQTEECTALVRLVDKFNVATSINESPYRTAAVQTAKEPAQVETAAAREEPAARQGEAKENDRSQVVSAVRQDSGPAKIPLLKKRIEREALEEAVSTSNADLQSAKKPAAASQTSQRVGSCEKKYEAQLGSLSCVACALEQLDPGAKAGVGNWISLVGSMAQKYYGPYGPSESAAFKRQVIEMVASYGFCTDKEYPAHLDSSHQRNWQEGKFSGRGFPQDYGFADRQRALGDIFGLNSKASAEDIFDDSSSSSGWDVGNVQERQWRFQSKIHAHAKDNPGSAFAQCGQALERRITSSKYLKMCERKVVKTKSGNPGIWRQPNISKTQINNNYAYFKTMATKCGVSVKRQQPHMMCDHSCWGSRHFSTSNASIGGCDPSPPIIRKLKPPGKRGEPSNPRNPGKPGEPGKRRYGGSHDRNTSNGDYQGNGDGDHNYDNGDPGNQGGDQGGHGGESNGGKGGEAEGNR